MAATYFPPADTHLRCTNLPHSEHDAVPGVQEFNRLATRGSLRIHWCTAGSLEVAERAPVGQDSSLHLGEGRSYLVIVLLSERCGQVLPEPVEMLADDPADLLVARGPCQGFGGVRPAALGMLASGGTPSAWSWSASNRAQVLRSAKSWSSSACRACVSGTLR